MSGILDWSKPVEAYHLDGRVIPVDLVEDDETEFPMRINPELDDGSNGFACWFKRDGTRNVGEWRIRNREDMTSNTVTIARVTEAEAGHYFLGRTTGTNQDRFVSLLRELGLIREETIAERFTRETGHAITPAIEAALNWDRGQ